MRIGGGCNGKGREGGDHKSALRQKKLKVKTLRWKSSNGDMKSKVEARESDEAYDDTILCSLSAAGFGNLVSRKRVRTLGKVAEQCDATDPPVPRKLRSAINKRVGRFASASSRHVKKRRHLSAIGAQISFVDHKTRSNGSSLFTEEEEVIADVLLSLSLIPSHSELTANKAMADSSNTNVASTSYSEGATKESDEIVILPSAAKEMADQAACMDKVVEQTNSTAHINPVPGATDQSGNINPPLSENEQIQDRSLETAVNLANPAKVSSNNSMRKQQKVPFDDSQSYPTQKPEAPLWLVNSNKPVSAPHEREKAKNSIAQETVPLVQTPLPSTPDGYLIKPSSSKLAPCTNIISEASRFTAPGNQDKRPQVQNVVPAKAWKRSITHVYVSHVIQMHLNKEKASQTQAKPEERPHVGSSRSPNSPALHKNPVRDEKFYTVHFDVRGLAQPPAAAICDMSAGRQKIVRGNGFLNLPNSSSVAGTQHVQYLQHPQIAPRGALPYQFQQLPYTRGNLAPASALQQMPQYMCSPGYALRPGLPASSSAMMKQLQQLMPTQQQQQQQQQMWQQYHVSQYQPRPAAAPPAAAAWHGVSSLRPAMAMLPTPAMQQAQMELFCAPYQGGGRQPQQLRLM
ncbi:hypothetical protein BS78_04G016400 [Paspalum vaginatum]|nr:hypothetical protein BS78_04G016400 [Paspalum vaginatum]